MAKRNQRKKHGAQAGNHAGHEGNAGSLHNNPFAGLASALGVEREVEHARAVQEANRNNDRCAEGSAAKPEDAPSRWVSRVSGKVVVRRETKGRAGKTATRVCGVPQDALEEVATQMKKQLGCGAVLDGGDLVLLGSLVDRAADWLEREGVKRVVRGN